MKRLIVIICSYLFLSCTPGATADRCLSKAEARKLWPTQHLYWSKASGGRCWSSQRKRRATNTPVVASLIAPPPAPPSLPPDTVAQLMPPPMVEPAPPSVLDSPRWAWVSQAMARQDQPGEVVFSTFQGDPPDIWPSLEPSRHYGMAAVLAILAACAFFAIGGYRSRLRLEKPLYGGP